MDKSALLIYTISSPVAAIFLGVLKGIDNACDTCFGFVHVIGFMFMVGHFLMVIVIFSIWEKFEERGVTTSVPTPDTENDRCRNVLNKTTKCLKKLKLCAKQYFEAIRHV